MIVEQTIIQIAISFIEIFDGLKVRLNLGWQNAAHILGQNTLHIAFLEKV